MRFAVAAAAVLLRVAASAAAAPPLPLPMPPWQRGAGATYNSPELFGAPCLICTTAGVNQRLERHLRTRRARLALGSGQAHPLQVLPCGARGRSLRVCPGRAAARRHPHTHSRLGVQSIWNVCVARESTQTFQVDCKIGRAHLASSELWVRGWACVVWCVCGLGMHQQRDAQHVACARIQTRCVCAQAVPLSGHRHCGWPEADGGAEGEA
jgi:hypothetical protein